MICTFVNGSLNRIALTTHGIKAPAMLKSEASTIVPFFRAIRLLYVQRARDPAMRVASKTVSTFKLILDISVVNKTKRRANTDEKVCRMVIYFSDMTGVGIPALLSFSNRCCTMRRSKMIVMESINKSLNSRLYAY